jgi:outer membrane protein TolC
MRDCFFGGTGLALLASHKTRIKEKRMNCKMSLWIALTVLSFSPVWGEAGLTVQQAVKEGIANSPSIKKLDAAVEGAAWKRDESVSGFLPHLSADGTHYLNARYAYMPLEFGGEAMSMPSAFPGTDLSLTASIDLFDGFKTIKGIQAGNLNKGAAVLDREDGAFKLERQIQYFFYQALGAQALLDVAKSRIDSLDELRQITSAREARGAGTRYDRLRVETLLDEAKANKAVAEDNVYLARKRLARVMGLESDNRVLKGTLPVPDPKRLASSPKPSSMDRSDLKALELRGKALDKQSGLSLSEYWPRVSLFGQKSFNKYGSFDPMVLTNSDFQGAYEVGLNLHWDLFDGGANLAKSKGIQAAAEQVHQALRESRLEASEDIETWFRRYQDQTLLYQAKQRNIERATESLRLSKLGLKEGTQTNLDVLEAEADLYNARAGSIQSQVDAAEAWMRLEVALGKTIQ